MVKSYVRSYETGFKLSLVEVKIHFFGPGCPSIYLPVQGQAAIHIPQMVAPNPFSSENRFATP